MDIGLSSIFQNSVIEKVTTSIRNIQTTNEQQATLIRKESDLILNKAESEINILLSSIENKGKIILQESKTEKYLKIQNATITSLNEIQKELSLSNRNLMRYNWLRNLNNIINERKVKLLSGFTDSEETLENLITVK